MSPIVQTPPATVAISDSASALWFKNAIIYEVPVRAFADSNGDGIGDFQGLTAKLDYLQDLGVTALWVLPFFPSPLRDDGYDIADYTSVNPIYGTLEDFKTFLAAAHQRDIRVIIELIINHTSDQHPWFQRARRAPKGSPERDFYVWSDTPEKYQEARIIFQDFETSNWTWDPIAKAYYWHRFYSHQPDLNYDHPAVRQAVFEVLDFWLEMGVDGLRMDAVPYLYEREGTNCENLPETHAFLKQLRQHVDQHYPNRMLLAEANQWPEDAAQYYGEGDECHMNFHFPLMPRLFMSLRMEDSFPITDILQQTPAIPDNCQWALFLRNHDELTLEMVTDEDRDYMYRVYAQDPDMRLNLGIRRRLAPLLGNDRRQIELLNSLLLSLPGTPVLYYGDEIGMGDNVYVGDRNGVRTPMQWSADRNAGFSRTSPQKLYLPVVVESEYHYEALNVEAQRANPNSLWYWMKRLIATRKRFKALGQGSFEFLHPQNRKVLAFTRNHEDEHLLVVANLSRFVQTVELDLAAFKGSVPVEVFGRTEFPPVGDQPYFLTLSPYAFYWLILKFDQSKKLPRSQTEFPALSVTGRWQNVLLQPQLKLALTSILSDYLPSCAWFESRSRVVQAVEMTTLIPVHYQDKDFQWVGLRVDYTEGDPQTYLLPLTYVEGEAATHLQTETPHWVIAHLQVDDRSHGLLCDALAMPEFWQFPLGAIGQQRSYSGMPGELVARKTALFSKICPQSESLEATFLSQELHPTMLYSVPHGMAPHGRLLLKLFRGLEPGLHPDLEMRQFLSQKGQFDHFAPVAGIVEYRSSQQGSATVGILTAHIPDTRTGWEYTLDSLRDYFEHVTVHRATELAQAETEATHGFDPFWLNGKTQGISITEKLSGPIDPPELATATIGSYLANVRLLAERTAEFHQALAVDSVDPDFAPEAFSSFYQRSIYQYARNLTGQVLIQLQNRLSSLPAPTLELARAVLEQRDRILDYFQLVIRHKITALRLRCHGNYQLQRVLYTGKDFVIADFEGSPQRNFSERRIKRSPLRDVATLLQSFHTAAMTAFLEELENGMIRAEQRSQMELWTEFWYTWVSTTFLTTYLSRTASADFLPKTQPELRILLSAYLLEEAIQDLGNALDQSPQWLSLCLSRILHLQSEPVL